jgi:hypothetical protein
VRILTLTHTRLAIFLRPGLASEGPPPQKCNRRTIDVCVSSSRSNLGELRGGYIELIRDGAIQRSVDDRKPTEGRSNLPLKKAVDEEKVSRNIHPFKIRVKCLQPNDFTFF